MAISSRLPPPVSSADWKRMRTMPPGGQTSPKTVVKSTPRPKEVGVQPTESGSSGVKAIRSSRQAKRGSSMPGRGSSSMQTSTSCERG